MTLGDVEDIYDLSPLQQGMLLHSLHGGDADTYVAQRSFLVEGPLDADALGQAWQQVVSAHPALRTSFHWDGLDAPLQVVHRDVGVTLDRLDWSDADAPQQRARLDQLLADDRGAGFDLTRPPLLRLRLARTGDSTHRFVWTHHMLPVDGWSVPIVLRDVVRRYRCLLDGSGPPPPAAPYRDYVAWLRRQDLDAAREHWTAALAGRGVGAPLGPLLPGVPGAPPGEVDEERVPLTPAVAERLRALAARHRVTLSTVLQAAWALVLQRYTGEAEVTYGCVTSGRPAELPGVDEMVGSFINTLPIRLTVPDGGDLGAWLQEVQAAHATARRYEYAPLARMKAWAGVPPTQSLFDSVVVLDNYPFHLGGGDLAQRLSIRPTSDVEKTSEPLTLVVTPEPAAAVRLLAHRARFPPGAVGEIMAHLQEVLAAVARGTPGTERVESVARVQPPADPPGPRPGDGPAARYPDADRTLPELVARQGAATPDAVAVLSDEGALRFADLVDRSRRVAAALRSAGAGSGAVVGICADRSLDMVTGVLGALLAGAAYLPLDPSLPLARLAYLLRDAGADVVLARRGTARTAAAAGAATVLLVEEAAAAAPDDRCDRPAGSDAAYVLYTSGSTGRPKGVIVPHRAVVNRLLWMQEAFPLTATDRVLHKTPLGFDVSVWELLWPLATGAAVLVARPGGHQDSAYLARTIATGEVTVAHFVPSMLHLFLDEPRVASLPALRRVVCSGEELPDSLVRRFRALLPDVALHNLYGPTEAAVDVTSWDCASPAPPGVVPIGHPVPNTQAHVLDRRLAPSPASVPGELYLGGVQLARGYAGRPGLTAERFVAHPLAGAGGRLYRTGDRVRRLPDGSLQFLGRVDDQVKVNGHRIEPGEVEQALRDHETVREAVVVARDRPEGRQLAAYVTGRDGPVAAPDPGGLRDALRRQLPPAMVPATVTVLSALPLTHNGKLDRRALPDPAPPPSPAAAVEPATAAEAAVAAVFRDVLGLPDVDVTASFFDLGGDSFAAVRAVRRIEGATVGLLAARPTARELAAALQPSRPGAESGVLLRLTSPRAPGHTLVTVPFGGGSAIAYRPLAAALAPDVAVLAVALPGHELGRELGNEDRLRPLDDVAAEAAEAVLQAVEGPVAVYGHCVGAALALELTRRLETAGRAVERLFVAASYPLAAPPLRERWLPRRHRAAAVDDRAELRYLQSLGGFDGLVDDDELAFVMRAYRHDAAAAQDYFAERWSRRGGSPPLAAPVTVVLGTDDPETPRPQRRYRAWERFGSAVELATVPGGGHYFLQRQPAELAGIVDAALATRRGAAATGSRSAARGSGPGRGRA